MNKKIAYITSGKIGLHRFTYNELKLLREKGIDFTLCFTQLKNGPCMPEDSWDLITASKFQAVLTFFNMFFSKPNILKLLLESMRNRTFAYFLVSISFFWDLKDRGVTSIHCQMGDDKLYIGYYLKHFLGIPLTVTVHAHELYKRKVYDDNEEIRRLYKFCDKVITISDFNADILKEKFGIPENKLLIMRLFPDIDHLNFVKNKTKILIVANWAEKKGYDTLLAALRNLDRNDFVLWVVGETYFSENSIDVTALVRKYKLDNKVAILGRQGSPILDILFESCDIFCLPSITEYYKDGNPAEREGIPVAIMEAMAWGKPVIATRHAGNPELIDQILIEEKNVEQLENSLKYLLDHKAARDLMGQQNQEKVKEKFSKENINILVNCFTYI